MAKRESKEEIMLSKTVTSSSSKSLRDYELTVLFRPDLTEKELDKAVSDLVALLEKNEARVKSKKDPAKRQLSYPIAKVREANFVCLEIQMDSDKVAGVDEELRLEEKIIRYLLVKSQNLKVKSSS